MLCDHVVGHTRREVRIVGMQTHGPLAEADEADLCYFCGAGQGTGDYAVTSGAIAQYCWHAEVRCVSFRKGYVCVLLGEPMNSNCQDAVDSCTAHNFCGSTLGWVVDSTGEACCKNGSQRRQRVQRQRATQEQKPW